MKNNSPKEILDKLKSSKNILITLHDAPDGDSLGACVAMKYFLEKQLNKKVKLISPDKVYESFNSFSFVKEIEFGKSVFDFDSKKFDVLLFLDFGSPRYVNREISDLPREKIINIDHHKTNTYFGGLNFVRIKPSTCSILIELFKEWKANIDSEVATRLLIGVFTDSGGFTFYKESLRDGVFLVDKNADYYKVVKCVNYSMPLSLMKFFALMTLRFKTKKFKGGIVGYSFISAKEIQEMELSESDVRGAGGFLQQIGGVDLILTLAEMKDYVKGSFRSQKNIDTCSIAKELGGGGHLFASAFRLRDTNLVEAERKVFEAIEKIGLKRVENPD